MSSHQTVIVVGTVAKDPDIRYSQAGKAVANLSIPTSEKWTDKQSGEKQERTEWHNCTMFGRLAEIVDQYVNKGTKLYVEGKLQTDEWNDKEGNVKKTTKIIVSTMTMLGGNAQSNSNNPSTESVYSGNKNNELNDDIPF